MNNFHSTPNNYCLFDRFDINRPRTHARSVTRGIGKLITIGKGNVAQSFIFLLRDDLRAELLLSLVSSSIEILSSKYHLHFSLSIGPLRRPSIVSPQELDSEGYYNHREGDTFEHADWRCFCTVNGDNL